jgi:hypothetical protein
MTTAGARVLRDDHEDLSREAVLLEWERKIEAAERRSGRFDRPASLTADTDTESEGGRFDRAEERSEPTSIHPGSVSDAAALLAPAPVAERRTITITGQVAPTARVSPARRRASVAQRQLAQPDRIALWAFLLGLFLVAVAAGTAHA